MKLNNPLKYNVVGKLFKKTCMKEKIIGNMNNNFNNHNLNTFLSNFIL